MFKNVERKIQIFLDGIGGIKRQEFVHGTLYLKLEEDKDCDFYHKEIRTFYKEFINPEGGVNMYFVGDEFAFDFVPAESEIPLYEGEKIRDEAKEESDIDIALNLEAESKEGK
jgi:hypothetical protein|tara:strand:+ start:923 stop:1261 length:339 start_codon:yes stop_codon:yes gene_type:complete